MKSLSYVPVQLNCYILQCNFLLQIIQSLNFWVRKACEIETNVVSIERVCEYANMDKEVSILFAIVNGCLICVQRKLRLSFHALCNHEEHFKSGKQGREALVFTCLRRHLFQSSWPWLFCFSESSTQRSERLSQKQVPLLCFFFFYSPPCFCFFRLTSCFSFVLLKTKCFS